MQQEVDDFVVMNTSGMVLELCEKYYDDNVLMLNNGAESVSIDSISGYLV